MSALLKAHPVSAEPLAAQPPRRGHFCLERGAGAFAFVLALAAMLLFMMNTIARLGRYTH